MASHGIESDDNGAEISPILAFGSGRRAMIAVVCFTATLSSALIYDVLPPTMGDLSKNCEVARSLGAMTTSLYLGGAMMPPVTAPYERLLGTRGQFLGMAGTIVIVVAAFWANDRGRIAATPP